MRKFVRKIALLFMVFGMASMVNAEELNVWQQNAKEAIEGYERFKAKYPKTYNACMNYDRDSKYYDGDICYRLLKSFTALKFKEREDGTRYYADMNWRELEQKYGEEGKKTLLKYGIRWSGAGSVSDLPLAESWAKQNEKYGNGK